jgi:hypothetical protein
LTEYTGPSDLSEDSLILTSMGINGNEIACNCVKSSTIINHQSSIINSSIINPQSSILQHRSGRGGWCTGRNEIWDRGPWVWPWESSDEDRASVSCTVLVRYNCRTVLYCTVQYRTVQGMHKNTGIHPCPLKPCSHGGWAVWNPAACTAQHKRAYRTTVQYNTVPTTNGITRYSIT